MNRLRRLQMLSGQQRWWLLQAMVLLPMNALAFGALGLKRWQRVLAWLASVFQTAPSDAGLTQAKQVAATVELAARRGFFKANCLQRSLTLWWLLRWLRIPTELRFGVNQDEIHVWVEHYGEVINDKYNIASYYAITYVEPLAPDKISHLEAL